MALHGLDGWLALVFHPIAVGGQRCAATDLSRGGRCSYSFSSSDRMSSSSALSLVLREADDGKRAGSVTVPDNSSASDATRERLSSNSLSVAAVEGR